MEVPRNASVDIKDSSISYWFNIEGPMKVTTFDIEGFDIEGYNLRYRRLQPSISKVTTFDIEGSQN
jgi:hypothetical protein